VSRPGFERAQSSSPQPVVRTISSPPCAAPRCAGPKPMPEVTSSHSPEGGRHGHDGTVTPKLGRHPAIPRRWAAILFLNRDLSWSPGRTLAALVLPLRPPLRALSDGIFKISPPAVRGAAGRFSLGGRLGARGGVRRHAAGPSSHRFTSCPGLDGLTLVYRFDRGVGHPSPAVPGIVARHPPAPGSHRECRLCAERRASHRPSACLVMLAPVWVGRAVDGASDVAYSLRCFVALLCWLAWRTAPPGPERGAPRAHLPALR